MKIETAVQTDSPAGHIHSRDGALFGRDGPKRKGQRLLPAERPLE